MSNQLVQILSTQMPVEQKIHEAAKYALTLEQAPTNVIHKFSEGKYIREASAPVGTFVVGHKHKQEHLNIVVKGSINLCNDDGTYTTLSAPLMFYAPPGRKMGYVVEDLIWQNVYETDETDIEKLEEMYLDKNPDEVIPKNFLSSESNYADFLDTIEALGFTEQQVKEMSSIETDCIPFPKGEYKVQVAPSSIEGKGLFATADINAGKFICFSRIHNCRTPAGRYTNHGVSPNAYAEKDTNGDIYLVASRDIAGSKGGSLGEEITIDYLEAYLMSRG